MKSTLQSYAIAFARMGNDALLNGWDPSLELGIAAMEEQLQAIVDEEKEIDEMPLETPSKQVGGPVSPASSLDSRPPGAGTPLANACLDTPHSSAPAAATPMEVVGSPPQAMDVEGDVLR